MCLQNPHFRCFRKELHSLSHGNRIERAISGGSASPWSRETPDITSWVPLGSPNLLAPRDPPAHGNRPRPETVGVSPRQAALGTSWQHPLETATNDNPRLCWNRQSGRTDRTSLLPGCHVCCAVVQLCPLETRGGLLPSASWAQEERRGFPVWRWGRRWARCECPLPNTAAAGAGTGRACPVLTRDQTAAREPGIKQDPTRFDLGFV